MPRRQFTPNDVAQFIAEAQARAEPIATGLVQVVKGPTMALLTLYVARAEILRAAQQRTTPAMWPTFLEDQRAIERQFDLHCDVVRTLNRDLIVLAGGNGSGVS